MSGQYARLKNALNRAEMTTPGPVQVAVFADDLHEILAHYIEVSTELVKLKFASATEACAAIPSIAEYIEALEKRIEALEQHQQDGPLIDEGTKVNQVINHYEAALLTAFHEGAQGKVYAHWNEARRLQQEGKE